MCVLAIIQSFRDNRIAAQIPVSPDNTRIQNGVLVISMGTFITEFFRSASSMLSGPRSFVNEMVLFIRKMLPSFSLDMRIIAPPCFICSASEGLEVGCSAPGCSAGCHPLCLRQQLRLSSVLSYLHANTLFCPLHHSQSLRAMKCPRNRPVESVVPTVSRPAASAAPHITQSTAPRPVPSAAPRLTQSATPRITEFMTPRPSHSTTPR